MANNSKVELDPIRIENFRLRIVGDTPFICHAWSKKSRQQMADTQNKKAKAQKVPHKPAIEFADSLYWLTEKPNLDNLEDEEALKILADVVPKSKFGFPSAGFKTSAINAGFQQGRLKQKAGTGELAKTTARGAFYIVGEFVEIEGTPTIREDLVRLNGKSPDFRYRGEFKNWAAWIDIKYNKTVISIEQIVDLFMFAGFSNGIGEWRPEKGGTFGTFHVE